MTKWELERKFQLDFIDEMIRYGETKNKNHESDEFKKAIWDWVQNDFDRYRQDWEERNEKLEE